jgi:hypothetical protein
MIFAIASNPCQRFKPLPEASLSSFDNNAKVLRAFCNLVAKSPNALDIVAGMN